MIIFVNIIDKILFLINKIGHEPVFFTHRAEWPCQFHSDDHICLYETNEGWLFYGDLFINGQIKYLKEDEDIYSILDSLKSIAKIEPSKMLFSLSGVIERPREAIHHKIA